jgi:hypothetical protein
MLRLPTQRRSLSLVNCVRYRAMSAASGRRYVDGPLRPCSGATFDTALPRFHLGRENRARV